MLILLLACHRGVDDTATETFPELTAGSCGQTHEWLPLEQMGRVTLGYQEDTLSLSADTINTLLGQFDLEGVIQAEYDTRTFMVRYTTQDRGEEVEATAFVTLPITEPGTEVPVLLWLHPTMGFTDECAPTALGLEGVAFASLWASQGFAVAAPDYLGMRGFGEGSDELHPYIVAEPTAVASLDSVRALVQVAEDHQTEAVPDLDRLLHWGASEGGFAALWTDHYQAGYLPEATSIGVVAAIPPTDLTALAERGLTEWSDTTGGVAGVLAGMQDWYDGPGLDEVLLPDLAQALPEAMMASCSDFGDLSELDSPDDVFTTDLLAAGEAGTVADFGDWGCYLEASSIHNAVDPRGSEAPVLFVIAQDDDLAWAPPARDDITTLCEQGYEIEHIECAGADHVAGGRDSLPQQIAWIDARLAGEPLTAACEITEPVECALTEE